MNDNEVLSLRKRLQDLHDMHLTGFVDDDQYAESKLLLEGKIVEAVMKESLVEKQGGGPSEAVASTVLKAGAKQPRPRAPKTWLRWVTVAALFHALVIGVYVWSTHAPEVGGRGKQLASTQEKLSVVEPVINAPAVLEDAAPPAAGSALAPTQAQTAAAVLPTGTSIRGTVALSPALALRANPNDTVFVYARAVDGPPMPLAVIRKQVKDLPISFELDDSMATWPAARVSAFPRIVVTARVSKTGEGQPRSGDLEGRSPTVAAGATGLQIEIGSVVSN